MKLSRRTNTVILWIVSLGLLVGMIITFTPTLGALGGSTGDTSAVALTVNGERITELDVARARQGSPLFTLVQEGPVAEDLDALLVDTLVRNEVVRQEAARQRIGNGEVREELEAFRERNGVAGSRNDSAYLRLIGSAGYDDASFREYLRAQLQVRAWERSVVDGVEVDDAEIETLYRSNQDAYRTDPRIVARQIVVDDADLADALRRRAVAGESFADLAREASAEGADVGGAVGGPEPVPVARPAFPTAVATAAFGLGGTGLTRVVESGGRFYLVDVEEVVPASVRPLAEVRDAVVEDATSIKRDALLEARVTELVAAAEVASVEGSDLPVDDPVVATVGDEEIRASEWIRATYANPQIQQALGPQTASLIYEFFKPSILDQLVDRALAVGGAGALGGSFVGSDAVVAQSALRYVARDVTVDDEAVTAYYEDNLDRYTVPASADVVRVDLADGVSATAVRTALLDGSTVDDAAAAVGAEARDLGTVRPGALEPALDATLFASDAFEDLPDGTFAVSDVLLLTPPSDVEPTSDADGADGDATGEEDAAVVEGDPVYVVLVASRTPERVRPLDEVRTDVQAAALAIARQEAQSAWLEGLRSSTVITTPGITPPELQSLPDAPAADEGTDTESSDGGDASDGDGEDDATP